MFVNTMKPLAVLYGLAILIPTVAGTPINHFYQSQPIHFRGASHLTNRRYQRHAVNPLFVVSGTQKPHESPIADTHPHTHPHTHASGDDPHLHFPGEVHTHNHAAIEFGTDSAWNGTRYQEQECSPPNGKIEFRGRCYRILSSGPCRPHEWIILNRTGVPVCAPRQCPSAGQVPYGNGCVASDSSSVCGGHEVLYLEYSGVSYCDCEQYFVYVGGQCVEENSRANCQPNEHIEVDVTAGVVCRPNACASTSQVLNRRDNRCYTKDYIGRCQLEDGYTQTFTVDGQVRCDGDIDTRNIFEVPALNSCPRGSKRDHSNRCRETFRVERRNPFSFRVPVQHTAPTRFGRTCPAGYVRYPNSSCQRPNSLFGR